MGTRYVTKTITVPVTITFEAYEVSDVTGAHIEDAGIESIDVEGAVFTKWPDAMAHINRMQDIGDWCYE